MFSKYSSIFQYYNFVGPLKYSLNVPQKLINLIHLIDFVSFFISSSLSLAAVFFFLPFNKSALTFVHVLYLTYSTDIFPHLKRSFMEEAMDEICILTF